MISTTFSDIVLLSPLAFFASIGKIPTYTELALHAHGMKLSESDTVVWCKEKGVSSSVKTFIPTPQWKKWFSSQEISPLLQQKKMQRAMHIIRKLQWIPFIRLVAVINSVALRTVKESSDIDLFVVTRPHRLWMTRTLIVGWLWLWGLKKNKQGHQDKACLGFFCSTRELDFASLQLKENKDIYLLHWGASLMPILDDGGYALWTSANSWIHACIPSFPLPRSKTKLLPPSLFPLCIKKILETFFLLPGYILEKFCFWVSIRRLYSYPENISGQGSVEISWDMLKLHPYDKRPAIQKRYEKVLKEMKLILSSKQ